MCYILIFVGVCLEQQLRWQCSMASIHGSPTQHLVLILSTYPLVGSSCPHALTPSPPTTTSAKRHKIPCLPLFWGVLLLIYMLCG